MTEVENLQNSLKTIVEIRSRASELWKSVAEGMTSKHGDDDKEKKFLSELKLMLDTIGTKIKYASYYNHKIMITIRLLLKSHTRNYSNTKNYLLQGT